jgi:hypothetical protein
MNAVDVGEWGANWAWSLPLLVLNVVVHVIGLGLINASVVRVLSGAMERRRFMTGVTPAMEEKLVGRAPNTPGQRAMPTAILWTAARTTSCTCRRISQ